MAKISLNKRIEATKLKARTLAPIAGPEVTIPFGALVESTGTDRDQERFLFLGEMYSVRRDIFLAATRPDAAPDGTPEALADEPSVATAVAPAPLPEPVANAPEAKLKFERLDAGAYRIARAKVPGGWLVAYGGSITFYPDAAHEWDGTSLS